MKDLFGNPIIEKTSLKSEFVIPPFSILDTASGDWQNRKKMWKSLGIKSEIGRKVSSIVAGTDDYRKIKNKEGYDNKDNYTSIFDPLLCELMYKWFVPNNGSVLDPFAGGSVRGIVCNYLDYRYTGIELREEQVDVNVQQGIDIVPNNRPDWICGDSDKMLNFMDKKFDFIFSCPPYYNLEVYCDDPDDLSNMSYKDFNYKYESIIDKSSYLLKNNRFACFVVGNCRDKNGYMMDLVGNTIRAFEKAGLKFYNDIVLKNVVASGSMRAKGNMKYKKVVKIHQNVLVFVKGNPKEVFKG
tara:strand:+ start:61 stop:954 length:894 start_codon:yes stop_codon:yes gene_type:complete